MNDNYYNTLTDKDTVNLMRTYIETHYKDLTHMAINITKSNLWEELLSETILSLLTAKRYPVDIFKRNKEFVYIFVSMKFNLYKKKSEFKTKFSYSGYDETNIPTQEDQEDELYDFRKEYYYDLIYKFLKQSIKTNKLKLYDAQCFILYFYPEFSKDWIKLTSKQFNKLNKNSSYRTISDITKINFQSIRLTVLKTLKYIKNNLTLINEPIYEY